MFSFFAESVLTISAARVPSPTEISRTVLAVTDRRDLQRAVSLCKEVIGMGGQRARYYATLGELFLLGKEMTRAQEAFRRALVYEPDNKEYQKRIKACSK